MNRPAELGEMLNIGFWLVVVSFAAFFSYAFGALFHWWHWWA